jgi:hypothetical protein
LSDSSRKPSDRKTPGQRSNGSDTPTWSPAKKKSKPGSPEDTDRKKAAGMLIYDPASNGNLPLPACPVSDKFGNMTAPEPVCMPFVTKGYMCGRPSCPLLHIFQKRQLSNAAKRTAFENFVASTPGLSFAAPSSPSSATPSGA